MPAVTDRPEDALAAAVAASGAEYAFGVPGGGANLELVGALERHGVRFVLGHAESPACIMAATYGHLTGSVSAAVVTRGPGAASAVNGLAQATLDRYPLLLVSDSVATAHRDRIAHQRIDQSAMLAPVSKASAVLTSTTAVSAVELAATWPAGGVHLDQDPSGEREQNTIGPAPTEPAADPAPVAAAIAAARRPVVIIGAGAIADAAEVRAAVEAFGAPTLTTYQAVGVVPTGSPVNAGLFTNAAQERPLLTAADVVVLIGVDMVEPIPAPWPSDAPVVSLTPTPTVDPYAPITHEVVGSVGQLAATCLVGDHDWEPTTTTEHRAATIAELRDHGACGFGPIELVDTVVAWARGRTDLTTTVDAGAHFLAIMPLWEVGEAKRLLISNGLATMGYAVPAAVGAALARPDDQVLALTGDGGLGMALAELETITRLGLPITVVVFNDAALSLIRIKQGDGHGGPDAVSYRATDFATVAEAHGMRGMTATTADEMVAALAASKDAPTLIDARIDPGAYPHLIRVTRG